MKGNGAPAQIDMTASRHKIKMNRRVHLRARDLVIQKERENEYRREKHGRRP